jgi:8-oxo-dGTP pyrophosphatase MutT (NUDIX family)
MPAQGVFPGGCVDPEDEAPIWRVLCRGGHADLALRVAAIRETFEECGILVARHGTSRELVATAAAAPLRTALGAGGRDFRDLVGDHGWNWRPIS